MIPRLIRLLGAALLATGFSQGAQALEDDDIRLDDANDLYQVCAVTDNAPEHIAAIFACRAFIRATVQYHDQVTDRRKLKRLICYPQGVTVEDGRAAYVAWAAQHLDNKERMGEVAVVALVRALAAKYPCK